MIMIALKHYNDEGDYVDVQRMNEWAWMSVFPQ